MVIYFVIIQLSLSYFLTQYNDPVLKAILRTALVRVAKTGGFWISVFVFRVTF